MALSTKTLDALNDSRKTEPHKYIWGQFTPDKEGVGYADLPEQTIIPDDAKLVLDVNGPSLVKASIKDLKSGISESIATTEKAGIVKPDGTTISVSSDGTIVAEFTDALSGKVAKAGDTMTGTLKMPVENEVRFGNDDNFYYIKMISNGSFVLYNKNGKGLFLQSAEDHSPCYWNGTNGYRLLTTADLPSSAGSKIQGAVNYSAQVSITSPFTCPTGGAIGFRCPAGDWNTLDLKINNIQVFYRDGGEYRGASQSMFATVSAGDVISWTGAPSASLFWPAK